MKNYFVKTDLKCFLLVSICLFLNAHCLSSISETSIQIEKQLQAERRLLQTLKDYSTTMEKNLKKINKYIQKYTDKYNSKSTDFNDYLSHPVNNYLLTRRSVLDVDQIVDYLIFLPANDLNKTIAHWRETNKVPYKDDIRVASEGLMNLQRIYNLETKALAKGNIKSSFQLNIPKVKAEPLSALDCSLLTVLYLTAQDLDRVNEWHNLNKWKLDDPEYLGNQTELAASSAALDQMLNLLSMAKLLVPEQAAVFNQVDPKLEKIYKLCRNEEEDLDDLVLNSDMSCMYFRGIDTYFLLAPIRVEEIWRDPLIVQFHDFISDADIRTITSLAAEQIQPALEISMDGLNQTSSYGTRFIATLPSKKYAVTQKLNKKLAMVTGENLLKKEKRNIDDNPFYLEIFGAAGHYITPEKKMTGIYNNNETLIVDTNEGEGSFMFYLSDVAEGGATIFPEIDVSVSPKKGSVLFWINQKFNEGINEKVSHRDCPVLYGNKLVLHKSFKQIFQIVKKPKCPYH